MKSPDARSYRGLSVEVLIQNDVAVVHDIQKNRYYQTKPSALPETISERLSCRESRVRPSQLMVVAGVALGMLGFNVCSLWLPVSFGWTPWTILTVAAYLVVAVALHEGAHILALRFCGRRIDRVGFKMNYIVFPAFYVRMNQSLMLTKHEKIAVHIAGLTANLMLSSALILLNSTVFHSDDLHLALQALLTPILVNALPILNSDGYRTLIALLGTNETRRVRANVWWIKVLKLLSLGVAIWYTWTWIAPIIP